MGNAVSQRIVCSCLAIAIGLALAPAVIAKPGSNAEKHWEELNADVIHAFQNNDFRIAVPLAEKAYRYALRRLGEKHPNTLTSLNNLAGLHEILGRYGKAEPLYKKALGLHDNFVSAERPGLLIPMNNLAGLYESQGRYKEAEPLYKHALQLAETALGVENPSTLTYMNNLAFLYCRQGWFEEAKPLYDKALRLREKTLGARHPDTLVSIANVAFLHSKKGEFKKAESLYKKVFNIRKEIFGEDHPSTLVSMNNLAFLYTRLSRFGEAGPLFEKVLKSNETVFGREHPNTIGSRLNYCAMSAKAGKMRRAFVQLEEIETRLLSRTFKELYATSSQRARRLYMRAISNFQDTVFSFALKYPEKEHLWYAANVLLRWKQVDAEESAFFHRTLHASRDPEMEQLKEEIAVLRTELSWRIHSSKKDGRIEFVREELETATRSLREKARALRKDLLVTGVDLEKVQGSLPAKSALVEFRQYSPFDFETFEFQNDRWAAFLVLSDSTEKHRVWFADLGKTLGLADLRGLSMTDRLYSKLFGAFDGRIRDREKLFIAPDGILNLISFSSLVLPDFRYLVQRQQVNRLLTGRDLCEKTGPGPQNILVAVGGVDYGKKLSKQETNGESGIRAKSNPEGGNWILPYLAQSEKEIHLIADMFERSAMNGRTVLFHGKDATEKKVKEIAAPPRILHLATHGFFLNNLAWADEEPMVLSGLALAGANHGLQGVPDENGDDGLFYSMEVLGLNLRGTELVTLSACDSGKGVVDTSEGVYGLVRAFRTAGAKTVLMALSKVGDRVSKEFMVKFYHTWLTSGGKMTPADAMHETRLYFINHDVFHYREPKIWAPFVMIGR